MTKTKEMLKEWEARSHQSPFRTADRLLAFGNEEIEQGLVCVELAELNDELYLWNIESMEKGHGFGRAALEVLTGLADEFGVDLHIDCVEAFKAKGDSIGMTTAELSSWYGRNGFTNTKRKGKMVRSAVIQG